MADLSTALVEAGTVQRHIEKALAASTDPVARMHLRVALGGLEDLRAELAALSSCAAAGVMPVSVRAEHAVRAPLPALIPA